VNPKLLVRVMGSLPFVGGLALDSIGLAFNLFALRTLTLFTVQAVVNANLAVTAVAAVVLLRVRLSRRDRLSVAVVVCGLVLLCLAAGHEGRGAFDLSHRVGLLIAVVVLAGASLAIGNLYRKSHPAILGALAGFLFGLFGISVRVLPSLSPAHLLTDPATYAAVVSSVTGFLFFATALQRGSVTAATAALVIGETAVPSLVGLALLGDATRPGYAPIGIVGFLLAVGGALSLSRYGEIGEATGPVV
jgi:drug/metabolite transporter (DMT)-like permease